MPPKLADFWKICLTEREKTNNEFGIKTVKLNLNRAKLAQNETKDLAGEMEELVTFFHEQNLNYDETVASMLLAAVHFASGNRKEMFAPLQRALDLSARFDYEYWLRGEIKNNPKFFSDEEVVEKLPLDLREISRESRVESREEKSEVSLATHALTTHHSNRFDGQNIRFCRDFPRRIETFCARCVDDKTRPRHFCFYCDEQTPPR